MLTMFGFEAVNSLIGAAAAPSIGKRARRMTMKKAMPRRKYFNMTPRVGVTRTRYVAQLYQWNNPCYTGVVNK